uniref:alcohol dehydrogenase-like 3 n=1 Tax=Erigeron canadensis TaxID=72917 RepID=UPI001CB8FB15|nr:alcohol dehydrogenase-like 3 [Erigeron canadensis]
MAILKKSNTFNSKNVVSTAGQVITCKAAVAWGPGQPLVVEEIIVDPPQKMEVRIKIHFTSICQTDLGAWLGKNEAQRAFPRILGHEASGVVESVGEGVEDMKAGDQVVPIFHGECGDCAFCNSKTSNLCKNFRVDPMKTVMVNDGKTRFWTKQGQPIYHFLNTSTFSEYTVIDSACVVKIDPNAPLKTMTLLSCGVSTGLGAAWNTANVQPGSTVAVFGLGAVGLAVVEGARSRGASRIIGIDINSEKLSKGQTMGVTDIINSLELSRPVHEEIREILEGGVDFSFECAGNLGVLREAFLSTHEGWGMTVLLGIHPTPKTLPIHPMELFDGRRIIGSTFGDFKGKTQLPHFVKQCMHGEVKLDEFITHELPFSEINQAFKLLMDGKSLRCILHL